MACDLFQGGLLSSTKRQLLVSAGQAAFHARVHVDHRGSEQSLGPVRMHLPAGLAGQRPAGPGMQRPCWVSQLLLFGRGLYPAAHAPGQVGVPSDRHGPRAGWASPGLARAPGRVGVLSDQHGLRAGRPRDRRTPRASGPRCRLCRPVGSWLPPLSRCFFLYEFSSKNKNTL